VATGGQIDTARQNLITEDDDEESKHEAVNMTELQTTNKDKSADLGKVGSPKAGGLLVGSDNSRTGSLTNKVALRLLTKAQIMEQYSEQTILAEREQIEKSLVLQSGDTIIKGAPFEKGWYPNEKKFLKSKLGQIYECTYDGRSDLLCRVMNYDRISSYQIESYFKELARLKLYNISKYIVNPMAIYISSQMQINIVMPRLVTLYEVIHESTRINSSDDGLDVSQKLNLLIQIARILNTFHSLSPPICHGNLNTHNIFLDLHSKDTDVNCDFMVRIGEGEMGDFKRYANMFYSYRSVSVSSSPECLKNQRQRQDPTVKMDVYSFGMIMWEILHEEQPFDGDMNAVKEYILEEDARPHI